MRDKLIEELADSTHSVYSHGVFGCFETTGGHYVNKTHGPNKNIRKYSGYEKEHDILFGVREAQPEFKARIWAGAVEEGLKLRLVFNDRKGDVRRNSHTDYTLIVPESEAPRVKAAIKTDPTILIEVFQKVFPDHDRSAGTLTMHEERPYFEE